MFAKHSHTQRTVQLISVLCGIGLLGSVLGMWPEMLSAYEGIIRGVSIAWLTGVFVLYRFVRLRHDLHLSYSGRFICRLGLVFLAFSGLILAVSSWQFLTFGSTTPFLVMNAQSLLLIAGCMLLIIGEVLLPTPPNDDPQHRLHHQLKTGIGLLVATIVVLLLLSTWVMAAIWG
jgi:hypothetical protein